MAGTVVPSTLGAIVALATLGSAGADVLYENTPPGACGGISNATEGVFGARRTLLDDFIVPDGETWRVTTLHHLHIWQSGLHAGAGTGMQFAIWSDADGTPGQLQFDAIVLDYEEVDTGRIQFSRPEIEAWTTFHPFDLGAGHYWFEGTVVGPEHNFWLEGDVLNADAWANFDDLGGLQPIEEIKGVQCDLVFAFEGERLDPVSFVYANGPPARVPTCGGRARVEITAPAGAAIDSESPMLHFDDGGGFVTYPLERVSLVVYDVVFPPTECGRAVQYYLTAATTDGVVFADPPIAPTLPRDATSASKLTVVFADDMEEDRGWTVESTPGTTGGWERALPAGGSTHAPAEDFDGSGRCWLTGLDTSLDGVTILTSPVIDLDGAAEGLVEYGRWFWVSRQKQELQVELSHDNGASWLPLEFAPYRNGWQVPRLLRLGGLGPLTSAMRFRLRADSGGGAAEAALDAFRVVRADCLVGFPGDLDLDGDVDFADLIVLLGAWGECSGCPEDLSGNGAVDFADIIILLGAWGSCP